MNSPLITEARLAAAFLGSLPCFTLHKTPLSSIHERGFSLRSEIERHREFISYVFVERDFSIGRVLNFV